MPGLRMIDFLLQNYKLLIIFILIILLAISTKIGRSKSKRSREKRRKILSRLRREDDD